MDNTPRPPIQAVELIRLSVAADLAGLPMDRLDDLIRSGGIPGTGIVAIGARGIRYLRRSDIFYRWLAGEDMDPNLDTDDLFHDDPFSSDDGNPIRWHGPSGTPATV